VIELTTSLTSETMLASELWLLAGIFVYSVSVALILPTPGEVVLSFSLPPYHLSVHFIIFISAIGKTLGSYLAYFIVRRTLQTSIFSEISRKYNPFQAITDNLRKKTLVIVHNFEEVGLALLLAIPGLPDTVSVYAFSAIETSRKRFISIVFPASVIRLYLTWFGFNSLLSYFGMSIV